MNQTLDLPELDNPPKLEYSIGMKLLDVKAIARQMGLGDRYIRQEIADGRLKAIRLGNGWAITEEAFQEWRARRKTRHKVPGRMA